MDHFRSIKMLRKSFLIFLSFYTLGLSAQDFEPRFLSNVPVNSNFVLASYIYSAGNILIDNTLPIDDLNSTLHSSGIAYARSLKFLNKLSKFDVVLPVSYARFNGIYEGDEASTSRSGLADPMIRFAMILIGVKPLSLEEFVKAERKKFRLGVQMRLRIPLGQYDETKFLNLGANRWALRTGVAASYNLKNKFIFELQLNNWLFTENNAFFNGNTIKQKPLISVQTHITYIIKPGIWIAASMSRSGLGETIINDVEQNNNQKNSRYGATFAYRLNKQNALKFSYSSGITTRYGADFTSFIIAYQYMWIDKPKKKHHY